MIAVRTAEWTDAPGIAAVHVAAWRSTYAGILPVGYLAGLSLNRQTGHYLMAMRRGVGVHVVTVSGDDLPTASPHAKVVGFATAQRHDPPAPYGEGEVETLYILDDWRDRGFGRQLMEASAAWLAERGCVSLFLWVLRDNPSRWFYQRIGGTAAAEQAIRVAGQEVVQTAYVWPEIGKLLA